jgi:single stranded DNA-binding protein
MGTTGQSEKLLRTYFRRRGGRLMAAYNSFQFIGRLTKDPEFKTVGQDAIPMATFNIAVDRPTGNKDKKVTDFFRCKTFRRTAEIIRDYTYKGSLVFVAGNVQQNNYEDEKGVKHYTFDFNVNTVQLLTPAKDSRAGHMAAGEAETAAASVEEIDLSDFPDDACPF